MAQVIISDFKYGLDRRRPRVAGVPGTLWTGTNIHITRGGDIELPKKFVPTYTGLSNTFGIGVVRGQVYVFGSADLAASMPSGVRYQRLIATGSPAMVRVLHNNTFNGKHYVIAEYDDGNIHHFYDGTRISALDAIVDATATYDTLANHLARKTGADAAVRAVAFGQVIMFTARTPGTPFTLTSATLDGGANNDQTAVVSTVQANVAAVAEVRAAGTVTIIGGSGNPGVNKISSVTVNAAAITSIAVDFVSSNSATATALAVEINNRTAASGYSASAAANVVTITAAPGTGTAKNGHAVATTVAGDVSTTTANIAGGVAAVAAAAQVFLVTFGGTFQSLDKFTLTLNSVDYVATGRASAHGTSAFVYKGREFLTQGSLYRWCKLNDPPDWTDANASTGAGFINQSNDSEGNERLLCSVQYQDLVSIFTDKSVRIYTIVANAANNAFVRAVDNSGTLAPRSAVALSNTDILYLDVPGVRSLRLRDTLGNAFVDDVGSPVDPVITAWMRDAGPTAVANAVAAIEPVDGRYLLAIGTRIFVYSYFQHSKIASWSYYEPGFSTQAMIRAGQQLYVRDASVIYLYGGQYGDTYYGSGEITATVELPFAGAKSPATFKQWEGIDIACVGLWDLDLLVDPTDDTKFINIGIVTKTTFGLPQIASVGEAPMFSIKAVCTSGGQSSISSIVAHHSVTETG